MDLFTVLALVLLGGFLGLCAGISFVVWLSSQAGPKF